MGIFNQKKMNTIFIFSNDDFREVESTQLGEMTQRQLVECLQGTIIGLNTINELTDRINILKMGPHTEFKRIENQTQTRLSDGMSALISELTARVGPERVEKIIKETILLIELEKNEDHDGE